MRNVLKNFCLPINLYITKAVEKYISSACSYDEERKGLIPKRMEILLSSQVISLLAQAIEDLKQAFNDAMQIAKNKISIPKDDSEVMNDFNHTGKFYCKLRTELQRAKKFQKFCCRLDSHNLSFNGEIIGIARKLNMGDKIYTNFLRFTDKLILLQKPNF